MTEFTPVVVEDIDMSAFQSMFTKIANTITAASELAKQVAELTEQVRASRVEIEALRSEVQKAREHNAWLDEQITALRASRDHAINEARAAQTELHSTKQDLSAAQSALEFEQQTSAKHWDTIVSLRSQLAERNAAFDQLSDDYTVTKREAENLAANLAAMTDSRDAWADKHSTLIAAHNDLGDNLDRTQAELASTKAIVAHLEEDKNYLQSELTDAEGKVKSQASYISDIEADLSRERSASASLRSVIDGIAASVRRVTEAVEQAVAA